MALSHNQRRRNNYDHDFDGEDAGFIAQFRNKGNLANESIYEVMAEYNLDNEPKVKVVKFDHLGIN